MNIIGLGGESGSGKNIFDGLLTAHLSHLGFRVITDSFAAPIKWDCRFMGWNGDKKTFRRLMQKTAEMIRKALWASDQRVGRWGFPADEHWRHEMVRLERLATNDKMEKLVYWLAYRNGFFLERNNRDWKPSHNGNQYEGRADFLIIPDVRRPVEADFCRQNGILLFLEGSHEPLADYAAGHESETGVQALRDIADQVVPFMNGYDETMAYIRQMVATNRHVKRARHSPV